MFGLYENWHIATHVVSMVFPTELVRVEFTGGHVGNGQTFPSRQGKVSSYNSWLPAGHYGKYIPLKRR